MASAKDFIGLIPPAEKQPRAAFFGKAGTKSIMRDQLSISSWLCLGAGIQGALFLLLGRIALIPAVALLLYRGLIAYAMSVGFVHNVYNDDVIWKKFSGQFPDETGHYGNVAANDDIVVFLIGTRINHPLGILAPGAKEFTDFFPQMVRECEKHTDEFGFLGMTSWLGMSERETQSSLMMVGYFKNYEGLHKFAHSDYHRGGWGWWNRHVKDYPYLSIFHETYQVRKGNWENIYLNSHPGGVTSTTQKYFDKERGLEMWASPVVDASRGVLKTSAGRMSRSSGNEHDQYENSPY